MPSSPPPHFKFPVAFYMLYLFPSASGLQKFTGLYNFIYASNPTEIKRTMQLMKICMVYKPMRDKGLNDLFKCGFHRVKCSWLTQFQDNMNLGEELVHN